MSVCLFFVSVCFCHSAPRGAAAWKEYHHSINEWIKTQFAGQTRLHGVCQPEYWMTRVLPIAACCRQNKIPFFVSACQAITDQILYTGLRIQLVHSTEIGNMKKYRDSPMCKYNILLFTPYTLWVWGNPFAPRGSRITNTQLQICRMEAIQRIISRLGSGTN